MIWNKDRCQADLRTIWHFIRKLLFKIFSLLLLWMPRRAVHLTEVKNVLVVIVGKYGMGDVVLCTPAIRSLKENLPDRRLFVVVNREHSVVLEENPFIDQLLKYDKGHTPKNLLAKLRLVKVIKELDIDLAIDFYTYQGLASEFLAFFSGAKYRIGRDTDNRGFLFTKKLSHSSPKKYQVDRVLELIEAIGLTATNRVPAIFFPTAVNYQVDSLLRSIHVNHNHSFVVIHPGTGQYVAAARQWKIERYAELADLIIEKLDQRVIFTGSRAEIELIEHIHTKMRKPSDSVAGKIALKALAALIKKSALFISANTGPMHIAVAVGTPTVSVFSHVDPDDHPDRWKPRGENNMVIQKDVGCIRCDRRKCKTYRCLEAITVTDVFQAVAELLARNKRKTGWTFQENLSPYSV